MEATKADERVEVLAQKLERVDREVQELHRAIEKLRPTRPPLYTDKAALKAAFDKMLADLGVERKPIGALAVQELIREAGLEQNELSRGIIAMREE